MNIDKSKVAVDKLVSVTASVRKSETQKGDAESFEATVNMPDYMTLQPITLNIIIHIKSCAGQNKTFVFHEVSPKPYSDAVWNSLHQLWLTFRCAKN